MASQIHQPNGKSLRNGFGVIWEISDNRVNGLSIGLNVVCFPFSEGAPTNLYATKMFGGASISKVQGWSNMKKILVFLSVVVTVGMFLSCKQPTSSGSSSSTTPTTYSVTYNANGTLSSGSVPTDNNKYIQGAKVTVLGNTGSMVKANAVFAGWTTSISGTGTSYDNTGTTTFPMGSSDIVLYAIWIPNASGITFTSSGNVIEMMGSTAFGGSLTIPNGVTEINFDGCTGLTSVNIPASVTSIGQSAFEGCTGLPSINFPATVTYIGNYAFDGCTGLTSVNIPATVTSIAQAAFANCTGLISVTISSASIGALAFSDCNHLTSLTMTSGVISIDNEAFENCTGLTTVSIPASVNSMGWAIFDGCSGLTSITVSGGSYFAAIGGVLFNYGETELIQYPGGLSGAYVTMPSTVTSIGQSAFDSCMGITSVTIPSSVTNIGPSGFRQYFNIVLQC